MDLRRGLPIVLSGGYFPGKNFKIKVVGKVIFGILRPSQRVIMSLFLF